jgi:spore cortex formation protein SpoVR/YcgB (stage V sporulation)
MSLLLVPATRENLEKSIEKSVDVSFVKQHLPSDFVDEISSVALNIFPRSLIF